MTTLQLAAPAVAISNIPGSSGIAITKLPTTYAGQGITGNTGFYFSNNGAVILNVITGSGDAPTLTFLIEKTVLGASLTSATTFQAAALSASGNYLFGPFSINTFNDVNGYVQVTFTGTATNTYAGLLTLPGAAA